MPEDKTLAILPDQDKVKRQMSDLAVGLFSGRGGAGELASLIGKQAAATAQRRAQAARTRAIRQG